MNGPDEAQVRETVRRYYRAHAHDVFEEDDVYGKVGGDLLAILDEDLLQRVLVEELGGDTLEQAFYEGQLFYPGNGWTRLPRLLTPITRFESRATRPKPA